MPHERRAARPVAGRRRHRRRPDTRRQPFRPGFDALALQHNDERNVWLWLDLEEHAEFLGDFIPEDLPLLLSYSGNALTHAFVPDIHAMAALPGMPTAPRVDYKDVPDMRARFLMQDWAA